MIPHLPQRPRQMWGSREGETSIRRRQLAAEPVGGLGERVERVPLATRADRGGADDQGAVCDGFGDGGVFAGGVEDGGGVNGRFGAFKGDAVFVDEAQIAEAEVVHRPGDGSDVVGVAGADEDDGEAGEFVSGEHSWLILGGVNL